MEPEVAPAPQIERRLGLDWCTEHKGPAMFCCASASGQPTHHWGGYNALRRYTGLMIKGRTHPFTRAGGPVVGVQEGEEALATALANATTERIRLDSIYATSPVTPEHVGLMLRNKAPQVRMGNHPFEAEDMPTVIRLGAHHVLADGHHRATAEWASGATHMKMRVLSGFTPLFDNGTGLLVAPPD